MKLLKNKLFILLSMFVILNLACDSESPTQVIDSDINLTFCLDMVNTIEGGAFDYADNNTTDQRVVTISLNSTTTDCETGSLSPVADASILFDWVILNDDGTVNSGSNVPHMQTIPQGNQAAVDIYSNESFLTDQSGQIKLYWIDEGQSGCIFLECEYTDSNDDIWSLDSPDADCESNASGNPFEVKAAEASYSSVSLFTLDSSIDILAYNDLPVSVDSSSTVTEISLNAIVKDENGVALQYIPVQFINLTPDVGTLSSSIVVSSSEGIATNNLFNIVAEDVVPDEDGLSLISIKALIVDETGTTVKEDTRVITIVPQSVNNIYQVAELDAVFLQSLDLTNNINISYSDSIEAQTLDANNVPISGVPIYFELISDDVGYIESQLEYTGDDGFARTVFHISEADLNETGNAAVDIDIQVTVNEDFNVLLERTYQIEGSPNIEYDVTQFNLFPQSMDNVTTYAQANNFNDQTLLVNYNTARKKLPFIALNQFGVGVSGVPVQFEIYDQSRDSYGFLGTALTYTCCSNDSTLVDSLFDWNGDGFKTVDENIGIATVWYNNGVVGTTDHIRAYIADPENQSNYIDVEAGSQMGYDEIAVTTTIVDELVDSISLNTIPASLNFGDSSANTDDGGTGGTTGGIEDDTATNQENCAEITAIAVNSFGSAISGVPITFTLQDIPTAIQYGVLTEYFAVTDSIDVAPFIGAQTEFCTFENATLSLTDDVLININAEIPNHNLSASSTTVALTQNSSSLGLITSITDSQLPNLSNNETTPVSVTVTNQDGYPIYNTLVQFESLTEDGNDELTEPIGSFDPTYSFTDVSGTASSIFNMGNDVGLATIITSAPEYNLSDTSYVSITASEAEYIQILQPYPNEITVSGGGGLESTELTVEVKDGNGNLVSEPYLIYFELGDYTPNGTFVNVEGQNYGCIESSNGTGSVTLNSGTQPGSIPVHVELFNLGIPEEACAVDPLGNILTEQPDFSSQLCSTIYINRNNGVFDDCERAFFDAIPVTVVTGAPHSGEINFSYVDIAPIGGGLYQVPLSVQLEDEWANPVQDSTNVYIWVEGFARSFDNSTDYPNEGAITDTVKWGVEIDGSIDIRDSLRYVLQRPDQFSLGQNPNEMNSNIINNSCQCYKSQLLNECSVDGIITDCIWEVIPNEPGSVVGEAKTGMLSPDNAYVPGVAWSYVYFGTGDMFERVIIKALTYDADGNILLIDSRVNHQNRPLTLPFWPGTVNVSSAIDAWDFGVQGAGSECYEPDWVNDGTLGDESGSTLSFPNEGVAIIASITDYYQYPVSGGTILLDADFSTPDEGTYNYCDVAEAEEDYEDCFVPLGTQNSCTNTSATNIDDSDTAANAHDWIACDPIDSDGDGITGDCDIDDFDNQCSLCVGSGGVWTPDNDDAIPGSFDDNQTVCKTNGNGQCFWIIHYNENVIPRQENNGQFTYQDRISTIITTLQNPIQTASESIDIILEKNP